MVELPSVTPHDDQRQKDKNKKKHTDLAEHLPLRQMSFITAMLQLAT